MHSDLIILTGISLTASLKLLDYAMMHVVMINQGIIVNILIFHWFVDYVVIGSDSGRIVILEYIPSKNTFERVTIIMHKKFIRHNYTFIPCCIYFKQTIIMN